MVSSTRMWVLFLLALGVSAGVAPSAARASCGDYVHVGETSSDQAKPEPTRPDPRPAPPPCSGPGCSRGEVPLPVSSVTAPPVYDWACPVLARVLEPDGVSTFGQVRHERPVSGLPLSVFHPPRPGC